MVLRYEFSLPIGLRLSLAFLVIILLTGLIGRLAIRQFSSLSNTTTELTAHDLPEAITLVHLRSQIYRQRDLEHSLLNGSRLSQAQPTTLAQQGATPSEYHFFPHDTGAIVLLATPEPTPIATAPNGQSKQVQQILSDLTAVLKEIAGDRQQMLAFERTSQGNVVKDLPLVQRTASDVLKTSALSERLQALVKQGQFAQARTPDLGQMEPLRLATIANVTMSRNCLRSSNNCQSAIPASASSIA